MSRVINISDKLDGKKPVLKIGEKEYEIDNTLENVFKFQETQGDAENATIEKMKEAFSLVLGKKAVEEIKIEKMSTKDFKVLNIALMALLQDMEYEEAEKRFRK